MAGRMLRPTPSCTDDLRPWQLSLVDKLSQLHQECFEKRKALTKTIQEFPAFQGVDALNEIAFAARVAWNLTPELALNQAKDILAAGPPDFVGTRNTWLVLRR